jgi:hypothetical protein
MGVKIYIYDFSFELVKLYEVIVTTVVLTVLNLPLFNKQNEQVT